MPALTLLRLDSMIAALKQHKYDPEQTLEQAYAEWVQLAKK